ncbi:phenylacetate-CoA oxygenase/reductase subunit PaaK [Luedemannella flava]|uniref:Phenylacetate-CoA oxygenase/reductase subunit PaaK n=1 Tax=Luedemannella flava TaxID=349316 RepID=A0ABN2ME87_9ACTN
MSSRTEPLRGTFYALSVDAVTRLTDDAVAVTLRVPEALRGFYAFEAGQHVTVRARVGGREERRSYSLCSTPVELVDGTLRIGVKLLPDGLVSGHIAALRPGDELELSAPAGHFTSPFAPDRARHYGAFAAGSGITPVLSLVATALRVEPASRVTVVFGNRAAASVMFADELADLKDRWPARLSLVHVLSRERGAGDLFNGRLDADRIRALLDAVPLGLSTVDEWFLCGPYGMVLDARGVLAERGVPADAVRTELFHVDEVPAPVVAPVAEGVELTFVLDGRESTVAMRAGERVLDAALRVRGELPYSCRGGVCATCRARVTDGEVVMARDYALRPDEVTAGYVLTCQATPLTGHLTVDYDA